MGFVKDEKMLDRSQINLIREERIETASESLFFLDLLHFSNHDAITGSRYCDLWRLYFCSLSTSEKEIGIFNNISLHAFPPTCKITPNAALYEFVQEILVTQQDQLLLFLETAVVVLGRAKP
jgi:hypothetical protein